LGKNLGAPIPASAILVPGPPRGRPERIRMNLLDKLDSLIDEFGNTDNEDDPDIAGYEFAIALSSCGGVTCEFVELYMVHASEHEYADEAMIESLEYAIGFFAGMDVLNFECSCGSVDCAYDVIVADWAYEAGVEARKDSPEFYQQVKNDLKELNE
jgi:hypothetical protein